MNASGWVRRLAHNHAKTVPTDSATNEAYAAPRAPMAVPPHQPSTHMASRTTLVLAMSKARARMGRVLAWPIQSASTAISKANGNNPQARMPKNGSNTACTSGLVSSSFQPPSALMPSTMAAKSTPREPRHKRPVRKAWAICWGWPWPLKRATRIWMPTLPPMMTMVKVKYTSPALPAPLISVSPARLRKKLSVSTTRNCTRLPSEIGTAMRRRFQTSVRKGVGVLTGGGWEGASSHVGPRCLERCGPICASIRPRGRSARSDASAMFVQRFPAGAAIVA